MKIESFEKMEMESIPNPLVKELECPVCLQYMTGRISICKSGHSICNKCREVIKNSKCPICNSNFVTERNLVLEKIGSMIKYPCRSCGKNFEFKDIDNHEKNCELGFYRCPLYFLNCGWLKKISNMKEHIENFHKKFINTWMSYKDINFYITFHEKETFIIFGYNKNENIRLYSAMYVGPVSIAGNYIMNMNFLDQTGKGYSLNVSAPCIPQCTIEDVFKSNKIIISREMLYYFRAKSGKFVSDITIIEKTEKKHIIQIFMENKK